MIFKMILAGVAATAAIMTAGAAFAQTNVGEPTGTVIDDRNGHAINHGAFATVTASFVAGSASTDIGFAFRDDPAFIFFDNASVVDNAGGGNLLINGDFQTGDLTGWTYQNPNAAAFSGVVDNTSGNPVPAWDDGSVQAYDTLDQVIATIIGDTYTVSYQYSENSGQGVFSAVSTNGNVTGTGGNGINIVTYAGDARPVLQGVPEPAAWALMLLGFGGIGAALRNRRKAAFA
jgi:hypothetical protein